jgi:hypothetical protein
LIFKAWSDLHQVLNRVNYNRPRLAPPLHSRCRKHGVVSDGPANYAREIANMKLQHRYIVKASELYRLSYYSNCTAAAITPLPPPPQPPPTPPTPTPRNQLTNTKNSSMTSVTHQRTWPPWCQRRHTLAQFPAHSCSTSAWWRESAAALQCPRSGV